ncbi:MAG TPA: mechanosensitive ion channel family protein [Thermoanaerobaculia bacterium]|nr:mechanosensitive ion channel family protein [Thermoanaerobaculia bacterium]
MEWLNYEFNGNPARDWLVTAVIVVTAVVLIAAIRNLLAKRLSRAEETETSLDDFLAAIVIRTQLSLIALVVLYLGSRHLELDPPIMGLLRGVAFLAALLQAGFWIVGLIDFWLIRYRRRRLEADPAAVTTITAFGFFGKVAVWLILLLAALDNFGFEITALVAGLGVGGIAVALATQNILGDLFASLSIVIDKPFVLGDFIVVGSEVGSVEHIGLKTTRVRSLSGEQLIFSNSDLLNSRIRNFKRMTERRALFSFGVLYSTSREQLQQIPAIVREIIESTPDVRFDRAHFKGFGDSSLNFEVVYWMLRADFNGFMDAQQAINLELISRLEALGVGFAFPTRTLHVESWPAAPNPAPAADENARP